MTRQRTVFPPDMVAHVWAQGRQYEGRDSRWSLYFEGPALYSYGRHYLAAVRLPDGAALISGRSHSVTTGKRVRMARGAARRGAYGVPDLNDWADILLGALAEDEPQEHAARRMARAARLICGKGPDARTRKALSGSPETLARRAMRKAGNVPAPWNVAASFLSIDAFQAERKAEKLSVAPHPRATQYLALALSGFFRRAWRDADGGPIWPETPDGVQGPSPAFLTLPKRTQGEIRRAYAAAVKSAQTWEACRVRNARAWADMAERCEVAADLARVRHFATPAGLADVRAKAADLTRGRYFRAEPAAKAMGDAGRLIWRAMKAGRAAGGEWQEAAKAARVAYDAARAAIETFPRIERDSDFRRLVREAFRVLRDGVKVVAEIEASGGFTAWAEGVRAAWQAAGSPAGRDPLERAAQRLQSAARAAGFLATCAGHKSEVLAADLPTWADLSALSLRVRMVADRTTQADWVQAIRGYRAAVTAGTVTEGQAMAARLAYANAARAVSLHVETRGAAHAPKGNPWTFAGFTAERLRAGSDLAGLTAARLRSEREAQERAAAEAKARAGRERKLREESERIQDWRDGRPGVRPGYWKDADSGALLRAIVTESDADGRPVAGVVQTSLGAEVPLPHAIRVFRFAKACRAAGKEWRANGKTLSVGHFRVDTVRADGGFTAGCHVINWPEIAALADRLGLSDLAPADTTQAREEAA